MSRGIHLTGFSPTARALLGVFAAILLAALPSSSEAAFKLMVETAGFGVANTTFIVEDQDLIDGDSLVGSIEYSATIGSLDLRLSVGSSKPLTAPNPGDTAIMRLDTMLRKLSGGIGGTVTISLTDTDFMLVPEQGYVGYYLENTGSITNGSGTLQLNVNDGNAEFGTGPFQVGPLSLNVSSGGEVLPTPSNPFSITLTQSITLNSGSFAGGSVDSAVTLTVPEPASLGTWGLSMAIVGLVGLRRVRRKMVPASHLDD